MKRLFDICVSLGLLAVCLPLFLVIAFAIRLSSRGPVLYRQVRCGKGGRPFTVYKFRTMHVGDPHSAHETWREDPRVFRVGRLLREYHLDELPQLWNVFVGQMSIVGPRPSLPSQIERYTRSERERLEVRPGITGLAQVSGNNVLDWNERIEVDREYVKRATLWMDLKILFRTISTVARKDGVYGLDGRVRDKA